MEELAAKSVGEVKGMVRLLNRLDTFRNAYRIKEKYEGGHASAAEMTAEELKMLEHYTIESERLDRGTG